MKRIVMTMLLSLMVMSVSSFTYQTEYNYQRSTFGTTSSRIPHNKSQSIEYRGIGYTTNYSNGQFNSTQYYQGTYNPALSSSGGGSRHGGQPRKVKGYDGNGNEIGDDSPEDGRDWIGGDLFWNKEDDYDYYWDETSGTWWRKKKGTNKWEKWTEHNGHLFIDWWDYWSWDNGKSGPINPYVHGYHENPVPIGNNYIWFMVCIVSIYSLIKLKRNKLKHSAY